MFEVLAKMQKILNKVNNSDSQMSYHNLMLVGSAALLLFASVSKELNTKLNFDVSSSWTNRLDQTNQKVLWLTKIFNSWQFSLSVKNI